MQLRSLRNEKIRSLLDELRSLYQEEEEMAREMSLKNRDIESRGPGEWK